MLDGNMCFFYEISYDNVHEISSSKDTWEPNSSIFIRHIKHNSIDHDIFSGIKKSI